jgi:hypothetical protein
VSPELLGSQGPPARSQKAPPPMMCAEARWAVTPGAVALSEVPADQWADGYYEHCTNPEAPSCALWVPAITVVTTLSHGSAIIASPSIPAVLPSQLPRTTGWYAKPRFYHILCQAVSI